MQNAVLESRPLYAIGTVARLTGLKPDTLRIWERRYGLGASQKSATGRRQYTQSDLDHLQLIAALVDAGSRIGEIATAPRKTLEMLLRRQANIPDGAVPEPKPLVLFVGSGLCDWLDEHQGCLASVDARLARCTLGEAAPGDLGEVDTLVVECATLGMAQLDEIKTLSAALQPNRVLATYRHCNERRLKQLESEDISAVEFPPDPAYLAFELGRTVAEKATRAGVANMGDLITAKPREFSPQELTAARSLQNALECECPRHITDLIRALASFEEYSVNCSVESWQEAAVHSCIYAYTGQARWLMEKALAAALDERKVEFAQALQAAEAGPLGDAA